MAISQVIEAGIRGSIAHPESADLIIDLLENPPITESVLEDYVKKDGTSSQEKINLDTTTTPSTTEKGDVYYDTNSKTVAAKITDDVTLKLGQDESFIGENINSTILKGQVVYVTGSVNSKARVQLAKADIISASSIIGIAAEDIPFGGNGVILTKGIISGLDTDEFFTGTNVYLSSDTLGGLSANAPSSSTEFSVAVGYIIVSNATTGSIYVNLNQFARIADMTDIQISSPLVDQVLRFNGVYWINGAETSTSASNGANFFLDADPAIPAGSGPQSIEVATLFKNPSSTSESTITRTVNNSTSLIKYFLYESPIGGTAIDSGNWNFNTYAKVSQVVGSSTLPIVVRKVVIQPGTITISGIGTSRTATATGATPFIVGDFNTDLTLATYLQTPNALFRITGYISNISVNIETVSTYTNESSISYSKHINLFVDTPVELNNTSVALISSETSRPAYSITSTDKLAIAYYARTDSVLDTTFTLYLNGTNNASYLITPLVTRHNDLIGLQGGSSTELYHMTLAEYNVVLNTSGVNTGDQDLSSFEVSANKSTSLVTDQASNTKYPSVKAVYDYVTDNFQLDLGYTPENSANKATSLASPDNTKYPTTQAVATAIGALAPGGVTSFNTRTGAVMPVPGDYSKTDVGLSFVDNTSDINKPVSTLQANAIGVVQDDLTTHKGTYTNPHNTTKTQVGLGNADNTSDLDKPISTATQTALNAKEATITATTTADYYRGDKTFQPLNKTAVGLANVVNADTTTTANITDSLNKRFVTDAQLALIGTGGDAVQYFETVSKNLKSYPYVLNYSTGTLTSIVYDIGGGNFITKTLNYSSGVLTTIVLSGILPPEVTLTTKTLTYTTGTLTSVSYS